MRASPVHEVVLRGRGALDRLVRGHPWIWRDALEPGIRDARPGEEVQVLGPDGEPIGRGIADPDSPIAVRLWTAGRAAIDEVLWRRRAEAAAALRERLFADDRTDAYRVLHGEGDRMPGFVVDRYGSVAVARTDGEAAGSRVGDLTQAMWPSLERLGVRSFVQRTQVRGANPRLALLQGEAPPDTVSVREHDVRFVVDIARGQKTGAFLDQRDNRRRVGELSSGRRVLNLYSYAGGFSLHAATGGATRVTSVDVAAAAHATAQSSFRLCGLDPSAHTFVVADVRAYLHAACARKETWDLVVSDPPSFSPNERSVARALAAYRGLHRACIDVLADGGIFCASSCSSHIEASVFLATLDDVTCRGRPMKLLELRGAGSDHPSLPGFPEGRYLKFAVLSG